MRLYSLQCNLKKSFSLNTNIEDRTVWPNSLDSNNPWGSQDTFRTQNTPDFINPSRKPVWRTRLDARNFVLPGSPSGPFRTSRLKIQVGRIHLNHPEFEDYKSLDVGGEVGKGCIFSLIMKPFNQTVLSSPLRYTSTIRWEDHGVFFRGRGRRWVSPRTPKPHDPGTTETTIKTTSKFRSTHGPFSESKEFYSISERRRKQPSADWRSRLSPVTSCLTLPFTMRQK